MIVTGRALNVKIKRWKVIVRVLMACAVTVALPLAWWTYRFYHPPSMPAPAAKIASLLKDNDPVRMLSQANHYYWGHNLPAASPLYQKAETLFEQSHDDRDAL